MFSHIFSSKKFIYKSERVFDSNIYEEGELEEVATCKYYLQVQNEGEREVKRNAKHYNLEMIIAIGYRVRSHRGTQFRRWATERLNEYLVKGFTMDDDRLKEMRNWGQDYFEDFIRKKDERKGIILSSFCLLNHHGEPELVVS